MILTRRTRRHLTPPAIVRTSDAMAAHPTVVGRKSFLRNTLSLVTALPLCAATIGCTIGAVAGTPTLANTTSAEQTQRIFWQDVKQQKWQVVQSQLLANTTWRNGRDLLTRDEVVPYLQKQQIRDFLITNLVIKANQDDMTLLYDLQLTTAASPSPVNLHVVSVWQQVPPPPDNASKEARKQAKKQEQKSGPYLLVLEDLAPDAAGQ